MLPGWMYIFHVPQVGKRDLVTLRTVLTDPLNAVQDILGNSTTVHRLQLDVNDFSLTRLQPLLPASFHNSQVFSISHFIFNIFTSSVIMKKYCSYHCRLVQVVLKMQSKGDLLLLGARLSRK